MPSPGSVHEIAELGFELADHVVARRFDRHEPVDLVELVEQRGSLLVGGDVDEGGDDRVLQVIGQITGDGEAYAYEGLALVGVYIILATVTFYE